jgi:hypothetical protein
MLKKAERIIAPHEDRILTYAEVSTRWSVKNLVVVRRQLKAAGIPIVRLNRGTPRVRLSDILRFEQRAIDQLPVGYNDGSEMRAAIGKGGAK